MIFFFQMMMSLLAYVATFSKQLHFWRIYFFTVSTSSEQLDIKSNQFDIKITFSKQLFLQSCYFFGTANFSDLSVLLSSVFSEQLRFQSEASTQHLTVENRQLFRTATFSENELVQNKNIYIRSTFLKQILLYSIKVFRKATFSTKLILQKTYLLKNNYSVRKGTCWKQIFQRSNIQQLNFSEESTFPELQFFVN